MNNDKPRPERAAPAYDETFNRILIEFCCGIDSKIGQKRAVSKGCKVVRVIINADATTDECTAGIIKLIQDNKNIPVMLFSAIPCTGGSQWQNINRRKPGGEERLAYHRRIFKRIWKTLSKFAMCY